MFVETLKISIVGKNEKKILNILPICQSKSKFKVFLMPKKIIVLVTTLVYKSIKIGIKEVLVKYYVLLC